MSMLWGPAGFIVGCIVWNYFGDRIKVWLHLKEKAAGAAIVTDLNKAKDKVKSKL